MELAVSARRDGARPDMRREIVAQGFANIFGAFASAFPASASLTRSALLKLGGASSRVAAAPRRARRGSDPALRRRVRGRDAAGEPRRRAVRDRGGHGRPQTHPTHVGRVAGDTPALGRGRSWPRWSSRSSGPSSPGWGWASRNTSPPVAVRACSCSPCAASVSFPSHPTKPAVWSFSRSAATATSPPRRFSSSAPKKRYPAARATSSSIFRTHDRSVSPRSWRSERLAERVRSQGGRLRLAGVDPEFCALLRPDRQSAGRRGLRRGAAGQRASCRRRAQRAGQRARGSLASTCSPGSGRNTFDEPLTISRAQGARRGPQDWILRRTSLRLGGACCAR